MIVFPTCKINLGLRILYKRVDGYHELETVFYPLPLTDAIEVLPSPDQHQNILFSQTGLAVNGDEQHNLCVKAYHLLKERCPQLPSVIMHLHKVIPMGAGLGGGSSDGAYMLKLLNEAFDLQQTEKSLHELSLLLGSDCPFFLANVPSYARGRGELLEPVDLTLEEYSIAVVHPGIHVSTAEAFLRLNRSAVPKEHKLSIKELVQQPVSSWKDHLINEFEEPVMQAHPEIRTIKEQLYQAGAIYASMTGSGSAIYGLFEKSKKPILSFPPHYFYRLMRLNNECS